MSPSLYIARVNVRVLGPVLKKGWAFDLLAKSKAVRRLLRPHFHRFSFSLSPVLSFFY